MKEAAKDTWEFKSSPILDLNTQQDLAVRYIELLKKKNNGTPRHANAAKSYQNFGCFTGMVFYARTFFGFYCFKVSYFFHKNRITSTSYLNLI